MDNELQNRMNIMPNFNPNILMELQQMLNDINPYVKTFRQASDMLRSNHFMDMKMVITNNRTTDPRHYNIPRATEVVVIMVGDGQEIEPTERDIVLQLHEGGLQQIPEIHPAYAPLPYVLMFPRGEYGRHPFIPLCINNSSTVHQQNILLIRNVLY